MKQCREKIRKAKAHLDLNLATKLKENNKYFFKYINIKRRARENHTEGYTMTKDQDQAEVFNAFFASVFHCRTCYSLAHSPLHW